MAVGLMRTLHENGLRVPEDVIVTGFDNVPSISLNMPTLTTIEQDFAGMTEIAVAELNRRIRGKRPQDKKEGNKKFPIGGKLVFGESCGCGSRGAD